MTIGRMSSMDYAVIRNRSNNYADTNKAMNNLSSGYKINSAADDAAGLAISQRMRGLLGGLSKAAENATHGIALAQTADGALSGTADTLNRMRELAVKASNGTYSDSDRALLDEEFQELKAALDQTASSTRFNNKKLLDGSQQNGMVFQVGANGGQDQRVSLSIGDMSSTALGLGGLSISSLSGANGAIGSIGKAVGQVGGQRSVIGATQNRLESSVRSLRETSVNTTASESSIRDTDMAKSAVDMARSNLMTQANDSLMAQSMNLSRSYAMGLLLR